jgi:hypothetical protein
MAAGCSRSSIPTSTTGGSGSSASGFRCDGLELATTCGRCWRHHRPHFVVSAPLINYIGGSSLNATAEGEHRFFAALFLWARLLSIAISGPPNAFYSATLVIELAMPFALFFATSRLPRSS